MQSLEDAFCVLEHYVDSAQVQKAILKACELVSPVGLSAEDAIRAARLEWRDYGDCLIALCADKAKADYIITRNVKGFRRSSVPAVTPEGWLELMGRGEGLSWAGVSLE